MKQHSSTGIHHNMKRKNSAKDTEENKEYVNPLNSKAMEFPNLLVSNKKSYFSIINHNTTFAMNLSTSFGKADIANLMHQEGVVFVLSGFVNPERGTLRSQALEMGAVYKPDWTSDCTLLVCAFPNTPKFRQVEADCGTIVSKEWISECYKLKKLIDIDQYLMHAGKPWRKNNFHHKDTDDVADVFSLSQLKAWAPDDFKKTTSWLESQEEKPEPDEIKKIAAEGIITCLQDAIEALREDQCVKHAIEQWSCVPRVVKELAKLEDGGMAPLAKNKLTKLAVNCRKIYAAELGILVDSHENQIEEVGGHMADDTGFDSDATIEMTEEEIDLAFRGVDRS